MRSTGDWLSAREAVRRLDVKLATLYSYASRGLVQSVPGARGRGRLYAFADVERLKARHDARAGHSAVAASALRWGEPTFTTSISDIRADGPAYRGVPLPVLLAEAHSFECAAELLWTGVLPARVPPARVPRAISRGAPRGQRAPSIAQLAADVAQLALSDTRKQLGRQDAELRRGRWLIGWLAARGCVRQAPGWGVAAHLYASLTGRRELDPDAVQRLDRALIVCADHELNVSTLAVRAAASAGAELYACLAAALHVLSGEHHGGVSARVDALLDAVLRGESAARVVRALLARGEAIPGFGHRLYPQGDPRGSVLLQLAEGVRRAAPRRLRAARELCAAMRAAGQPEPNLDLGLTALCAALRLPRHSAGAIFAVGRSAGWIAHVLEQRAQGFILRPRARYVPSVSS